jgi:hypothetical protein
MEAAHLKLDDAAEVREEGGRIVIEPVRSKAYELKFRGSITPDIIL